MVDADLLQDVSSHKYQCFDIGSGETIINFLVPDSGKSEALIGLDYKVSRSASSKDITADRVVFASQFAPTKDAVYLSFSNEQAIDAIQSQLDAARKFLRTRLVEKLSQEMHQEINLRETQPDVAEATSDPGSYDKNHKSEDLGF